VPEDPDSEGPSGRRVVIASGLTLVAVASLFGAALGAVIPAYMGLEETTIFAITFTVSPLSFGLYGGVSVAVFLLTTLFVVIAISRFDENAVD